MKFFSSGTLIDRSSEKPPTSLARISSSRKRTLSSADMSTFTSMPFK